MKSWAAPDVPRLPGTGRIPVVLDSATGARHALDGDGPARIYVCGITPYDATHLGHAATYVMFDLVHRALLDAGRPVEYAQNVTDVDDPLLERAERDGVDWRDLAAREVQLFRDDMEALRVLPPQHYIGVVEHLPAVAAAVARLLESGEAYTVPADDAVDSEAHDVYLDLAQQPTFGRTSGWTREQMMQVFADRGGDPDRAGKRDPFDPLLWRAARPGEPSWDAAGLPTGRPGWHIECTCIAHDHLGSGFDLQGGGTDLVFPHHEMSAVQSDALYGRDSFAGAYIHQAMVAFEGEKMSKSRGNLVLVSRLREEGVDPMAVRVVLLGHHYATPWEWTDDQLVLAEEALALVRSRVATATTQEAERLLAGIRERLADDLDTPGALTLVQSWAHGPADGDGSGAALVTDTLDALLGIRL